ncbi:MAG TPA: response regulator transcription factor [Actinoplanes sp.]|jgi:DNA-binding NarL/FixJ family response regulator|nr:response regulator transcription factor [Actinoplanes sp.]
MSSHGAGAGDAGVTQPVRVLIADDEALFRDGLRLLLQFRPGIQVVADAADGAEAVTAVRTHRTDVVLMDIQMPRLDGIEATRRIIASGAATRILMLTTFGLDQYVYDALRAGASGFLLKSVPPDELVAGIGVVARGEALLAPALTRRMIEDWIRRPPPDDNDPRLERLTEREREVLRLVGNGLSNRELATRLHLADATVKTHVSRVLAKIGARDRVQAVVLAYETGLVTPGDGRR